MDDDIREQCKKLNAELKDIISRASALRLEVDARRNLRPLSTDLIDALRAIYGAADVEIKEPSGDFLPWVKQRIEGLGIL